jgi:hypothetical protein
MGTCLNGFVWFEMVQTNLEDFYWLKNVHYELKKSCLTSHFMSLLNLLKGSFAISKLFQSFSASKAILGPTFFCLSQ